jgi:flagellin
MEAANGRIVDVDIAAESTRMAKYNVLVQASASMLAQANASSDIALMLIR